MWPNSFNFIKNIKYSQCIKTMSDKFLGSGGSNINLSNGSATIFSATLGAAALSPSRAVKTNSVKQLISSNLDISDVNNLSTELSEKDELLFVENDVHTTPDAGKIKIYAKTDNNLYKLDDLGNETGFGGAGDVVGPLVSDDSTMAFFDGTTGKLLKENVGFKFQTGLTYGDQLNVPDIETADHFSLNRELDKITNITAAVELPTPYTTMAGTLDVKTVASFIHGGELDFNIGTATLDSNAIVLSSKAGNIESVGTFTMNHPTYLPPSSFQKLKFEFGNLFNIIRSEGDGVTAGNLTQLFIDATQINVQSPVETTQTVFTSPQSLVTKQYVDDEAVGTTSLQQAYVASGTNPLDAKIDIDNTREGIQLRNMTGASANTMLEVVDIAGANRWAVDGFGSVSKNRLDATKDLKTTHATNTVPKFAAGLFAGDDGYKIYNETTSSYPLELDALGNNVSTIGNLTIKQPSSFPGTYYQKLKFDFGTLYNVIRSEGNSDGGLARLDIDAADLNIGIGGFNRMAITSAETTISNDLKADVILKNTSDAVRIEGSVFRTGGLLDLDQIKVLSAIDVGSNVISSVSNGVALTDAVNKSQLDTKIDLTQKGAANGVCPLDGSLPQAKIPNAYLPDLAITQVYVVADNAARDLIASVQSGDVAVVSTPPNNFIWNGPDETAPLTPSNWVALVVPQGTVTQVNGATGNVSLTTDQVPETLSNPYFIDARRDELINRSGTVAMTSNLNIGDNNIVDCNTVFNGGGDLTLQSSGTVQVASGSKINLNCVDNVEIPNCDLDMKTNSITNATQITTGVLDVVSLTSGPSPNINVFNDLSMSAGSDIKMNGQNILNAGNMSCDTLSSATATSIIVNHDLVMSPGEYIYTSTILAPDDIQVQFGNDIWMGSKKVRAGINTFDSLGLSSTSILDLTAPTHIDVNSPSFILRPVGPAGTTFTMEPEATKQLKLLTNDADISLQSFGTAADTVISSGRNVLITGASNISSNAPVHFIGNSGALNTQLRVNNIVQDTNKSAWASMLRPDYSILNITSGTFPLLPYTGTLPNGAAAVKNMTADPANMVVTSQIGGYYKFDASFECNTGANAGSVLMLIYINGIPFFQTESFVMKSVWSTHSITYIDRVDRPPGTTYGVRCQAVNGDIQVRQASFNLVRLTDNT
jgi:hypothetical protein